MHGKIRRKKLGEGELMLLLLLLLERVVTIMHSRKLEDFSLSPSFLNVRCMASFAYFFIIEKTAMKDGDKKSPKRFSYLLLLLLSHYNHIYMGELRDE